MADNFQDFLQDPTKIPKEKKPSNKEIVKEIEADNEKDYLRQLKKKNKEYLIDLSLLERERIARYIKSRFDDVQTKHNERCDQIDEADEVYRMVPKTVKGADSDVPNYRTPLSAVTMEVIHANIMNVFHTPKDIMRVLPVEEGDIPKVKKLGVFGNWSMKNEIKIFERTDRLFHNSEKIGECPYIMHWVKEYGTEIEREMVMNPAKPEEPLVDPDTQEPIYQERDKEKLLYNGPKLEIFSRKDYFQPLNALMDVTPEWEMRRIRLTYDQYLREELQGKMYKDSIKDIQDWSGEATSDTKMIDYEGDEIPVGKWEKEFVEFYGRIRLSVVKRDKEGQIEDEQELEGEFIGIMNMDSEVLGSLRKNKFPLKMRPIGIDYFIPDDDGRRIGRGVIDVMESPQTCYDALYNQYCFGTIQSNSPVAFFTPMGNLRDEPIKIRHGYMYPTSDPSGVKLFQFPAPDASLQIMLELVSYWAQMLFGISAYSAGLESKIDPTAPAKKAALVVAQGSVRLNMIIKRKNQTLRDIFKRWFLLYKENMPKNKYMRIAGASEDMPWKFESVSLEDFALKSIPDFELTGNILNVNKTLEANKAIAIYNMLVTNPFFSPKLPQGIQALYSLTKWLIDKLDDTGLSKFLPEAPGEDVKTPEEENARFLQGDYGSPTEQEDHISHIKVHREMLTDDTIPDDIKEKIIIPHINEHIDLLRKMITQRMVMSEMGIDPNSNTTAPTGGRPDLAGGGTNVPKGTNQIPGTEIT